MEFIDTYGKMEEELIKAVRTEKCLYDVKQHDYKNIKLKDSIWKRIAEGLNLKDGREAKKAWEKLRNNHRDALRRQKIFKPEGGSRSGNIKPWRYQENMAFLIPHMVNRSININIREEIQRNESSHTETDTTENVIQENVIDSEESENSNEERNQSFESSPTGVNPTGLISDQVNKRKRHKRDTFTDLIHRSIEEHQQRVAEKQRVTESLMTITTNDFTVKNVKSDPLFHFFMSMYETTKTLPALSQHHIKTNIFSLVSQEESKNLIQHSPRPHSSKPDSS